MAERDAVVEMVREAENDLARAQDNPDEWCDIIRAEAYLHYCRWRLKNCDD